MSIQPYSAKDFFRFVYGTPEGKAENEYSEEFVVFSRRLTIRIAQSIGIMFAVVLLVCWPTDYLIFRDQPVAFRSFSIFRISCTALMLFGLVVTEIVYRRALRYYWVVFVFFLLVMSVVPIVTVGEVLADSSQPFFYTLYSAPAITVLLPVPLRVRIGWTVAMPVAWLTIHGFIYPEFVEWPTHGAIIVSSIFIVVCSVLSGHGFYRLVGSNFNREQALQAERERVADLNRQMNRLFANVSHEMRTPLTVIRGNLRRLGERVAGDEKMTRWLDGLDRNAARLSILVDQFLAMSRNDETVSSVHVQSIVIHDFVESIVDAIYAGRDYESKPTIVCDSSELMCRADPSQLADILYNLISNARKFSEAEHGEKARVEVTIDRDGDFVVVRVKDNGPGIPEAQLNRIFKRFHQAHDEEVQRRGGVGLGLAIVDELVRANGGSIEVASMIDAGTEFALRLPKSAHSSSTAEAGTRSGVSTIPDRDSHGASTHRQSHGDGATVGSLSESSVGSEKLDRFRSANKRRSIDIVDAEVSPTSEATPNDGRRPSIMIIDDEPDMLEHLTEILQIGAFDLHTFSRGDQALKAIDRVAPALVITDLMMPHIGGGAMIDSLLDRPKHRRIPIIVISADHTVGSRVDMLERGAVDFMTKPFRSDELIARVQRHLAVARWTSKLDDATRELTKVSQKLREVEQESDQRQFAEQVAQVLHNDFGQLIAACRVEVELAGDADSMPEAYKSIGRLREALAMLTSTFRDTLTSLTQGRSRDLSVDELQRSMNLISERLPTRVDDEVYSALRELPTSVARLLTRAVQECMTNVLKHSSATRAWVDCRVRSNSVHLTVNDDGRGFGSETATAGSPMNSVRTPPSAAPGHHLGIESIRTQLEAIGGTIVTTNNEFGGASVVLECPLKRNAPLEKTSPA